MEDRAGLPALMKSMTCWLVATEQPPDTMACNLEPLQRGQSGGDGFVFGNRARLERSYDGIKHGIERCRGRAHGCTALAAVGHKGIGHAGAHVTQVQGETVVAQGLGNGTAHGAQAHDADSGLCHVVSAAKKFKKGQ